MSFLLRAHLLVNHVRHENYCPVAKPPLSNTPSVKTYLLFLPNVHLKYCAVVSKLELRTMLGPRYAVLASTLLNVACAVVRISCGQSCCARICKMAHANLGVRSFRSPGRKLPVSSMRTNLIRQEVKRRAIPQPLSCYTSVITPMYCCPAD